MIMAITPILSTSPAMRRLNLVATLIPLLPQPRARVKAKVKAKDIPTVHPRLLELEQRQPVPQA